MTKAVLISFFRYQPHDGEYYRAQFEMFLKSLPFIKDEFDKLYIIDQEWGFTEEDKARLNAIKETQILPSEQTGHHWVQFKNAIPHITEERILFLDNDVLFWKKGVVKSWFDSDADLVTAWDGSGGLAEPVRNRFPLLKKLEANRMGSYYFIINKKTFNEIPDFDFAPVGEYPEGTYIKELDYTTKKGDWSDSFGLFTIKMLGRGATTETIIDDRSSLLLGNEDEYLRTTDKPLRLGYYHIRNGNMPIYMLASRINHMGDYDHQLKVIPRTELLRELAWFWIFTPEYRKDAEILLTDSNVSKETWNNYIDEFKVFHDIQL